MKRLLLLAFMMVSFLVQLMAQRTGTMEIRGVACQYDTLIHRHIGPGVTYTQFQFNSMKIDGSIPYKMRTHLITIDRTNPYNRISPYIADDTFYEVETQEIAVAYEKKKGLKPFASVNGYSFYDSKEIGDPCELYELKDSHISDSKIWYENDASKVRFYTDMSRKGYVGALQMNAIITSSKGTSVEIGQINHYRDHVRNSSKLALFCNGIHNAKDTWPYDGLEVFLKGDIKVGTNKLTVERKETGCGVYIGEGLCVITGVGYAENFLKDLEIGETVTIDVSYTDGNGNSVVPTDSYMAFIPNCVTNGVAYGDPRKNLAYPATGVSKDGNTIYIADLEISDFSNAPLRCLEDFLIQVGAWNAFYHDGGPSAEMTIDGKFVTNNSIGFGFNGRYIPEGVMIYSTAPDDNEITMFETANLSSINMTVGEQCKLKVYAYNQYGEMIDENAIKNPNVELSCSSALGFFYDGEFYAVNPGSGYINVAVKGKDVSLKIPVTISQKTGLIITPGKVFTGENRPVQLSVKYNSGTEETEIDPKKVTWFADNSYIVSSCENGLLVPYIDGTANVTATYEGVSTTISVTVENLEEEGTPYIELTNKIGSLSDINLQMPSVPHSIFIETVPKDNEPIVVKYVTGDKEQEKVLVNKGAGIINGETITLDFDAADTYPVTVKSVSPATTEIKRLIAVYTNLPSDIEDLFADKDHFEFSRSGENLTLINCSSATDVLISVYSFNGTKLAEKQAYLPEAESCTLDVKLNEPVIVRVQTKNGVQVFKLAGE